MDTRLADPLLGVVLDRRYRIETVLAHGGMSTVYSGWDMRLDRPVAVKVMAPSYCADPAFVRQFGTEARAAARLSHPNVVSVFDQGHDGGRAFLVMELVRGRTLRRLLRERGALPADLAVSLLEPVLAALAAAHRAGLAHRDVKPENVLLADDGAVKVADFGLVRPLSSTTGAGGGPTMGTAAYIAPEQVSGGAADPRADVYSAGIVLYEMLVGAPPYQAETALAVAHRHVHEDVPAPSTANAEVPPELDALVLRATRRDPSARPADAGEFLAELGEVRTALALPTVAVPPRPAEATRPAPPAQPVGPAHPGEPAGETGTDPDPAGPDGALNRTRALRYPISMPAAWYASPPTRVAAEPPAVVFPDEQRAHRRRGLIALVAVLLIGAGAAGAGWTYGVLHYTRVPTLRGLSVAAAVNTARAHHLRVRTEPVPVFDDEVRPGLVAGSRPGGGGRIARHGQLTLLVSKGPAPRRVPDLSGQDPADALHALSELELTGDSAPVFSDVDSGDVAGTDPPAGATVKIGAKVTVLVSKGRLPDTTGDHRAEAVRRLKAAGLSVRVSEEFSDDADTGDVVRQDPSGGIVRPGATVRIVVSKGPESVRVPNVIGESLDDARAELEKLGFHVRVESLFGRKSGRVVAQTPLAGFRREPGSTIRLEVV